MATLNLLDLTTEEKINAINSITAKTKGHYVNISFKKDFAPLKSFVKQNGMVEVKKLTTMTVRLDVDYTHMADYDNHNHTNPNGATLTHISDNFSYNEKTGKYLFKCYNTYNKNHKGQSLYYYNNIQISKSDLQALNCITSTEFAPKSSDPIPMFTIMLDNLISIEY